MSARIPGKRSKACEWCDNQIESSRAWSRFCDLNCKRRFEKAARQIGEEVLSGKVELRSIPKDSKTNEYFCEEES